MSIFSENLQYYRRERNLTQLALGEKINAGYTTISMLESGRFKPDSDTVKALADILNVTVEDLLKNLD